MGIIPRFGVFGDVENGRERPVYRVFWGVGVFWGVREGFLWWMMGLAGGAGGDGPCWASLGLSKPLERRLGAVGLAEPLERRLGAVRGVVRGVWGWWVVLDHADESDDGA